MSENMITSGFMAELVTPVGKHTTEEWEAAQEALYESDTNLELNYEGTLVFSRDVHQPSYDFSIQLGTPDPTSYEGFKTRCNFINVPVKPDTVQPYICQWYNGADSPMSDMTLARFLKG